MQSYVFFQSYLFWELILHCKFRLNLGIYRMFTKTIEVSIYFYLSTCILKTVCYLHRQHADLVHQSLWLLGTHIHKKLRNKPKRKSVDICSHGICIYHRKYIFKPEEAVECVSDVNTLRKNIFDDTKNNPVVRSKLLHIETSSVYSNCWACV